MRVAPKICVALTFVALPIATLAAVNVVGVIQRGRAFNVAGVQVRRGEIVRFSNDDQFLHQVFVATPAFNFESAEQEPGTTVDIPFTDAGLFEVRCHIHPKMLLHVEVR